MKYLSIASLFLCALFLTSNAFSDTQQELGKRLQQRINKFHKDSESNGEKLRVIYFHASDTEPQADYQNRLDRIMKDIQEFYHTEMVKLGFSSPKLPLDMENGKLKIHTVKGLETKDNYNYNDSSKIKRELARALQGKVDFSNDYVLVLCGLAQKRGENHYYFHSPYYGGGSHRSGLCWAADCEIQDTLRLKDKNTKMRYDEHTGSFRRTMASFNSLYIGGIAHELGHGLSLPHNGETPAQKKAIGTALMGSGNYTYRNEVWGGGKGSFMTLASALRLAVHPLFTGSDRSRNERVQSDLSDLKFKTSEQGLHISGQVNSNLETIAVIAYTDPPGNSNYNANPWVAEVINGKFDILASFHKPGDHTLRLTTVHPNGATTTKEYNYTVDKDGSPNADNLIASTVVHPIEQSFARGNQKQAVTSAEAALKQDLPEIARLKLQHLVNLTKPEELIDLTKTTDKSVSLSSANWVDAQVGWGKPARNQYYITSGYDNSVLLELNGKFYTEGLYAHAPSNYTFNLDGKWKQFDATVGLHKGARGQGTSIFTVKGDGAVLYKTKLLKSMKTEDISLDITGVKKLELIAESGVQGNAVCWSIWGHPRVNK